MTFSLRACITAALLSAPASLWAAPGALDTAFGNNGIALAAVWVGADSGNAVAVRPDGKVLVAGYSFNGTDNDFALVRYNADGSLGASFDSGKLTTAIGTSNEVATAIAFQPDGKMLVAGRSWNAGWDFAVVRYNADGSLDTGFDTDGKVTTEIGTSSDYGYAVALQPDGKVLVAGYSNNGADNDIALVRYNADGSLDTGFDTDGKVTTAIGAGHDVGNAIAVQPDGKVLVAGHSNWSFALVRYNANGSLDTGFGTNGKITTIIGAVNDVGNAIALQPDGKVLVAGYSFGANMDFALVRYNTNGSLDTGFGTNGKVTTAIGAGDDYGNAIALQPDGKVLVAGYSFNGTNNDFALVRYNADGSLDTGFDSNGVVTTPVGAGLSQAYAIALQPDGKALVAGYGSNGANDDVALVRYVAADTAWDTTPAAISFTDQTDVVLGSTQTSNTLTVSGLGAGVSVPLQIEGGSYSLNGGAYTTDMGWVQNGDTVAVRHTASASLSTATNTTLTLGGIVAANNSSVRLGGTVSDVFTSTTLGDAVPDPFSFTDLTDQAVNTAVTSDVVTVAGIGVPAAISVSGGEYSIGCTDTFTTDSGAINGGETVCVRHTTSNAYSTTVNTTLTIGGVSDVFSSTTAGDNVPDPFSFTDLTDQALNTTVTSDAITVAGTAVSSVISVTDGEYSIGCTDTFTTADGTINNGETVCVRHTTSDAHSTTVNTTLTIGGVSDVFSSTTEAVPAGGGDGGGGGAVGWAWSLLLILFGAARVHRRTKRQSPWRA